MSARPERPGRERAFAFRAELEAPVHSRIGTARAPARPGEVRIDATWSIETPPGAPVEVRTAASDLRAFFRKGFDLGLPLRRGRGPVIRLSAGADSTCPPSARDEGYTLKVAGDGITVAGNGPRGALHGAFRLQALIKARGAPCVRKQTVRKTPRFAPRVLRSFSSPYYTETGDGKSHYSDAYLSRLAHLGYDAIWLRGDLRDLSRSDVFPELGAHRDRNQAALNLLIRRARRWGIGVYLYLCEPYGLPVTDPFWKKHPDVRGPEGPERGKKDVHLYALCTSTQKVKRWLRESAADLLRGAPGLEGLILITASEHTGHCKQRQSMAGKCPRCADRSGPEIVAEVVRLIRDGVRDAASPARVVAWNWAWDFQFGPKGEAEIVRRLPRDAAWMGNAENGGVVRCAGKDLTIWEYSLCYPGPSPAFRAKALRAQRHGNAAWAKVQINVTHELAAMPYVPVPFLLRDKFAGLARARVEGLMCCWIFGGYPGVGARLATEMMWDPFGNPARTLLECAAGLYGRDAAPLVVKAWRCFSRGYGKYPFDRGLYSHPLNDSPAHPFHFRRVRRRERPNWTLRKEPFGDILNWCVHLSPEATCRCYEQVLKPWDEGLALLREALKLTPAPLRREARRDLGVCEAVARHVRSGLHLVRFLRLRDRLPGSGRAKAFPPGVQDPWPVPVERSPGRIRAVIAGMERIVRAERELVTACLPLVEADSRIGYHSEGGYRYRPRDLRAKLKQLDRVLTRDIPDYLARMGLRASRNSGGRCVPVRRA